METTTIVATLAGVLTGIGVTWICWKVFGDEEPCGTEAAGSRYGEGGGLREGGMIVLEPEPTQEDVKSFFAKYDAAERNVPVAMVAVWKQMAAEKMAAVKSAEEFAFEQGRLAAYCEIEAAFLEVGARALQRGSEDLERGSEEEDER